MSGRIVVDTNAVIAFRAGHKFVVDMLLGADKIYTPVVVLGELLYGAKNSSRIQENLEAVIRFTAHTSIISVDQVIAHKYSEIRSSLKKIGKPIPENDLWIAATAITVKLPLVSNDKHFENLEGLEVIHWH